MFVKHEPSAKKRSARAARITFIVVAYTMVASEWAAINGAGGVEPTRVMIFLEILFCVPGHACGLPLTAGSLLLTWISNYIHFKMWDEIGYPSPNFNGCIVKVWEMISNFITRFTGHVITYPWDIEFPNYYVNIQLPSQKQPALTASCHLLALSNSIS